MAEDVPSSMAEVMPTLGMAEIVQLGAGVAGLMRVWPMVVDRLKGSMIQGRTDKSNLDTLMNVYEWSRSHSIDA
jgi:hypothetical protein